MERGEYTLHGETADFTRTYQKSPSFVLRGGGLRK